jgi:hypothetical protein
MRDYEVENKINMIRSECTAEQMELVDGMIKLTDNLDSITMDSIKVILPDKFSEICMDCTDEESMKAMMILLKLMSIYKDSVNITRLSAVTTAQQSAQLNRIEKSLTNISKKLEFMDTKLNDFRRKEEKNK